MIRHSNPKKNNLLRKKKTCKNKTLSWISLMLNCPYWAKPETAISNHTCHPDSVSTHRQPGTPVSVPTPISCTARYAHQ